MKLCMELEAEFDAQAFGPELRALKVRISADASTFELACTVPWSADPAQALEAVKADLLREDEACFVLFRTRAWALMSFIPPDAPGAECALYDFSVDSLRLMLGGASRVPNLRRWSDLSAVTLDEQVEQALPMSYPPDEAQATVAAYVRGGGDAPAPPAPLAPDAQRALAPPPAEALALLGRAVVLRGLTGRPELNGRRGTARDWLASAPQLVPKGSGGQVVRRGDCSSPCRAHAVPV